MGRFRAFLIHLGISLVIFAVLAGLVVFVWYPDFFFASDGGWQGIRIIALVDLVLGPTLTFIVFNRRKPIRELRRDLSVIGTLQAVCLMAGVYVVYAERPLALVYVDGSFFSLSADDYREAGMGVPDLDEFLGSWPKRVMVELPDDPTTQSEIRLNALQSRQPLRTLATYYVPFDYSLIDVDREALSTETMQAREEATGDVTAWITTHGGTQEGYAFFRFGARYGNLILGIDREHGEIAGILDTNVDITTATADGSRSEG